MSDTGTAPWVVAHRGSSGEAPENTLAAFRLAIDEGADALELDVQSTVDGHLVVFHDHRLDRTTDGHGLLTAHTLDSLRRLDAGTWKHRRWAGERIPTLVEVARLARGAGVGLVVEAKGSWDADPTLAHRITETLQAERMLDHTLLIAFEHRLLTDLWAARRDVRLGPLVDAGLDVIQPLLEATGAAAWCPNHEFVGADRVAQVHDLGRAMSVWTVDDPARQDQLMGWGVDALTTNHPGALVARLRAAKRPRRPWPGSLSPGGRGGPVSGIGRR